MCDAFACRTVACLWPVTILQYVSTFVFLLQDIPLLLSAENGCKCDAVCAGQWHASGP